MNSITRRKSAAAALCFFLLAICAVVWAASAGTTDAGEGHRNGSAAWERLCPAFVRKGGGRMRRGDGLFRARRGARPRWGTRPQPPGLRADRSGSSARAGHGRRRCPGGSSASSRGLPRGRGHIRDGGGRVRGRIQPGGRSLRPGVRGLLPHRRRLRAGRRAHSPAARPGRRVLDRDIFPARFY